MIKARAKWTSKRPETLFGLFDLKFFVALIRNIFQTKPNSDAHTQMAHK